MEIWDISLSRIVDAYLRELERMSAEMTKLDLDVATEFLLIAATLVELKTRRLLPGQDDVDLDEEFALWEERDLLLARLLECKTFKDAAQALSALAADAGRSYARRAGMEEPFLRLTPDVLADVTPSQVRDAFIRATRPRQAPRVDLDHVAPIRISVRDAVDELIDELPRSAPITFRHLTQALATRLDVIVRFLAILELYKQGLVELEQAATFGALTIIWVGEDVSVLERELVDSYEG